jgi:hypothetical protein
MITPLSFNPQLLSTQPYAREDKRQLTDPFHQLRDNLHPSELEVSNFPLHSIFNRKCKINNRGIH